MSFTFLSKKRAPYSYVRDSDAPPVALYKPKFKATDVDVFAVDLSQKFGDPVEKRQSYKPKPKCEVVAGGSYCNLAARR